MAESRENAIRAHMFGRRKRGDREEVYMLLFNTDGTVFVPGGGHTGPPGPKGSPGSPGPVGPSGPEGIEGPPGERGSAGQATRILGALIIHTPDQLPDNGFLPKDWDRPGVPKNDLQLQANDAVIYTPVEEEDPLFGRVYQFFPEQQRWMDIGRIVGPEGPIGPQGPEGPQGLQGNIGLQGEPGNIGLHGDPGSEGPQGPKGDTGADSTVPGPQGPKGDTGADSTVPGPQGPKGDTGPQGNAGPGVASGGAASHILSKKSATDYDTQWGANTGGWTVVRKNTDKSVASSAVVQDDPDLQFLTVVGVAYEIELLAIYANAVGGKPDIKCELAEDATARGATEWIGLSPTDAAQALTTTDIGGVTATFGTAVTKRIARAVGHHVGNGGILKFRWAQNTADASPTIVYAGSVLRYRQLA